MQFHLDASFDHFWLRRNNSLLIPVSQPPVFALEDAEAIAAQHFGIFGAATTLDSERDQNFRIQLEDLAFVLKVANPATPVGLIELENSAIQLANGCRYLVAPRLIKSNANRHLVELRDPAGNTCQVRMISFLEGDLLATAKLEHPGLVWRRLGEALGELDQRLAHLNHHPLARREFKWDLKWAPDIVENSLREEASLGVSHDRQLSDEQNPIPDAKHRVELLQHYLEAYRRVENRMQRVPLGVIHNDANDYNLLIDGIWGTANGTPSIGLIDFGDLLWAHQINELAIAAAYACLHPASSGDRWQATITQLAQGYDSQRSLSENERSVLFPLMMMRLCQSVCLAQQQRRLAPENEYLSISEGPAWQLLESLKNVKPIEVHDLVSSAVHGGQVEESKSATRVEERDDAVVVPEPDPGELISEARQRWIAPSFSLSYDRPLHIVRGAGQYLFDFRETTYLDCVNNVCHVGHCHPHVVAAAEKQIRCLNTNTRYLHGNLVRYAERLTQTLPDSLEVCFFVNSGSEANDLAWRLAKQFTGRTDAVVIDHAYHGHTAALIDLSPYKFRDQGKGHSPEHVHVLPMPDTYRGEFQVSAELDAVACGQRYAVQAEERIQQAGNRGRGIAAFFAESILGCGGQVPLPPGYLAAVYQAARDRGGVCIADEVQVGFGRVGTDFWAFQQHDVVPDIVTMGKPIGNGHPLAAVVTTREIADAFDNGIEYFNTFGGNPVSCAIGLAVLDVIETEQLQRHALQVGQYLIEGLGKLQASRPWIGDVRGSGLFIGIEIVKDRSSKVPDPAQAKAIVEAMKSKRILLSTDGPDHNVIKFKPPMVFSEGDADRLLTAMASIKR